MITKHVRELAEKRGIKTAYELSDRVGVAFNAAYRAWNGNFERLDIKTLDKLCEVLKCQPGQILKYRKQ